ncbi:hypothetical protein HispidOSU_017385, partial [Sigmodon hispidus]
RFDTVQLLKKWDSIVTHEPEVTTPRNDNGSLEFDVRGTLVLLPPPQYGSEDLGTSPNPPGTWERFDLLCTVVKGANPQRAL